MPGDWDWLIPIVIYAVIGYLLFSYFQKFAQSTGLDKLLLAWYGRRKPVEEKRDDYDARFIHDLKRAGRRNRVPCKFLYVMDARDEESPWTYYGKVKGVNAETDVAHIVVRHSWNIFSDVLFLPRNKLSDLHSKELFATCAGFRPVNHWFWVPIWGSLFDSAERERLRAIVLSHIQALYDEFGSMVIREEGWAQTVSSMEPGISAAQARARGETRVVEVTPQATTTTEESVP